MKLFNKISLCLLVIFAIFMTIGGTMAYMKAETNVVTNTFQAGEITYTLMLDANAKKANEKYQDSDVIMPSYLSVQKDTDLSVTFSTDKTPVLTGYQVYRAFYLS